MNIQIKDCLEGRLPTDRIFPFLWLHGEAHERIKEEILAIKNSGINEFCAESRPYENFCKNEWWEDFGFILKTAGELGMRVWLLDDRAFPTGYANGYLEKEENAHLRKVQIRERQSEIAGPRRCIKILAGDWLSDGEEIIGVSAYRHTDGERLDFESCINLMPYLTDGVVYWDVPDGVWRICILIRTDAQRADWEKEKYYIDMLNPDSCHAMIDAVYQPHFEHFGEYFGNVFRGFFSDEPGFANRGGTYQNKLGDMYESFPWRDDLPSLIAESAGLDEVTVINAIPSLWEDMGDITSHIRMHYMEVVTKLYSENFSFLLGNWCREHGVMYIGHVIEDNNAHQRLGYGAGHFFRALDGQDMAGMDSVLMQTIPGITDCIHRGPLFEKGYTNPDLYRYTLPKMTASHSHLQPLKKGRAMCECFGAYGWAEGPGFMKQQADLLLASGINHFIPHAFSAMDNDNTCPPVFYDGGDNIQYPYFKNLMEYMARCSHVLSGGVHKASVLVFYNAESEWTGGEHAHFQQICRILTQNLIDFDIASYDMLKSATVSDGNIYINGESFGALIISQSEVLPLDRLECFARLSKNGARVIFENSFPAFSPEKKDISGLTEYFECVSPEELPGFLKSRGIYEIECVSGDARHLRFYHVTKDGDEIYMFSNEAVTENLDVGLKLPVSGEYVIYEPWSNKAFGGKTDGGILKLKIEKGNALIVAFTKEKTDGLSAMPSKLAERTADIEFDIFTSEDGKKTLIAQKTKCSDSLVREKLKDFGGTVIYEAEINITDGYNALDLGEVGEIAEVILNEKSVGVRVNAPYVFDISGGFKDKPNKLEITVTSNMANRIKDSFSRYLWVPASGITGEITECIYE